MQLAENGNDTKLQDRTQLWKSRGARYGMGGGGGGSTVLVPSYPRAPWLHYHNGDGC